MMSSLPAPLENHSPTSLEHLYSSYRAPLLSLCAFWLKDDSQAEDLVHDSILKAYLSISSYNPAKPLWPWIATIAKRRCMDHHRRRSFILPCATLPAGRPTHDAPLDEVIRSEDLLDLSSHLAALPRRQRRALLLYAVEDWSYSDIASLEGISIKAARQLVVRARKALRTTLRVGLSDRIVGGEKPIISRASGRKGKGGDRVRITLSE